MTKKRLLEYNSELVAYFHLELNKLLNRKDYYGVVCIAQILIEIQLRFEIAFFLGSKAHEMDQYWNFSKKNTYLSNLIDYYRLLGADKDLVEWLVKFNSNRNRLVHDPLSNFRDEKEFQILLWETANIGGKIVEYFVGIQSDRVKKIKKGKSQL